MAEENINQPATVPDQPEAKPPVSKGMPLVIALVVIIAIIGIANLSSLVSGNKKAAPRSALTMRPATARSPRLKPASEEQPKTGAKSDPMVGHDFDTYDGRLYRIFEGTLLEGVVTNHIDGGFSGRSSSV